MASKMSLLSVSEEFVPPSTPLEEQVNISLDFYEMLFKYLRLLRFDTKTMSTKHHIKFDKDLFKVPNQKAFQFVVHFLFTKLDASKTAEIFRDVWPIVDRKQEAEFRKKVKIWLVEIQESNKNFQFGHINPSMFLSPGGEKFAHLMCALATHILNKMPRESYCIGPPSLSNKHPFVRALMWNLITKNQSIEHDSWAELIGSFKEEYNESKLLARELVAIYRNLHQEETIAEKELCLEIDKSSLSDAQKRSIHDPNNNAAELYSEIEEAQNYIDSERKQLLVLEKSFLESWNVISSVISIKKNRPSLNGGKLINAFPLEFIDRYQNCHSGTRLELQKKNERYDLVPLLNLVLFSITTAGELSNNLNFPSLEGEMMKIYELKKSIAVRSTVSDQLCTRWRKISNDQTEAIDKMLTSKFQGNVPMALQSVTPFRNVLGPDKNSAEATPPFFRAALGMTPVEIGAKAKMRLNQLESGRPSLDLLLTRRPAVRDAQPRLNGQNGNVPFNRPMFEKTEMRKIDKRRSQESVKFGLDLCRTKSLTPEPSKHSPLNRTPIGSLYLPAHTRVSRPSSLAASPVVERVMQLDSSFGGPSKKQQRTRRSLPQVAQQLEAAALVTPRMTLNSAVLDEAANNIVHDLVNFNSPVAATHGIIDPNSSFEKCAFVSRNLIPHSPQQPDEEKSFNSNLDLLKVLETKFVSPRRSSLLSWPGSRNNSPLPSDWMESTGPLFEQGGLLETSNISLIDDILDFSYGPQ